MNGTAMPDVKISDKATERQRRVRAGFVAKGTSFTAWCKGRGVKHQNARKAITGEWHGPKAAAIVAEILAAAGVDE
jgi:hypothetical protein